MAKIETTIRKDGQVQVHIDLPPGERCEQADEALRAVMALLGADFEGPPPKPKQTDGAPQRSRAKAR